MLGVWIGSLQNMYPPQLGAGGVEEHSILHREPLQRVARSVYPIMGVVYDGERARQTGGEQIKGGFHRGIKGVDNAGRRYHALDPETFYWAHATFFMLILKVAEYFCGGLTEAEKRQLFDEHVQWYAMYGMSMKPVPRDVGGLLRVLGSGLPRRAGDQQGDPGYLRHPDPPQAEIRVDANSGVGPAVQADGGRPALDRRRPVRSGGARESRDAVDPPGDEVALRLFGKAVELAFWAVPDEIRLHPRALSAYRRASGHIPADAPPGRGARFHGTPP